MHAPAYWQFVERILGAKDPATIDHLDWELKRLADDDARERLGVLLQRQQNIVRRLNKVLMTKLSKADTGYVHGRPEGFNCGSCGSFLPDEEACRIVEGEIHAEHCCNFWSEDEVHLGHKISKANAVYITTPGTHQCRDCYFWESENQCKVVGGDIEPEASCNLWEPAVSDESSKEET